ncbi:MAG: hypothetical protein FJ086_17455, partial [Deltaproteobacteria bacterium]|nr:hypothetical protein [Deltaproteobacteria bacterium]
MMMRWMCLQVCLAWVLAGVAHAQQPADLRCSQPHEVDRFQLLRRLSLDLRGRVPSYEEYLALEQQPSVPASTVEAYLATDGFKAAMRRYHEAFLWPNVSNVPLAGSAPLTALELKPGGSTAYAINNNARRTLYRGAGDVDTAANGRQCGDFEQTAFDPAFPGQYRVDPNGATVRRSTVNGKTVFQEGWRWVHPYWEADPAVKVKICAFDAQEIPTATVGGKTVSCGDYTANNRRECGCGPGLKSCFGPPQKVSQVITASLREQVGRAVDRVSAGGAPYTDLVLSTRAEVNGPIATWKRDLSHNLTLGRIFARPDAAEPVPARPFTEEAWEEVDRGGLHAGVLTLPAWFLRFQTNRSRANQFRIAFECEAFEPPSQLEAPGSGSPACHADGTDLTQRCTCRYCHRQLEPLAASFGAFAEAGTTLLDAAAFPRTLASCVGSTAGLCRRFYVTDADADNPGALLPWQYADAAHPDIVSALAAGPRAQAQASIQSGAFARCAVKRMFRHLVKRDMHVLGAQAEEAALLGELATGFEQSGYA